MRVSTQLDSSSLCAAAAAKRAAADCSSVQQRTSWQHHRRSSSLHLPSRLIAAQQQPAHLKVWAICLQHSRCLLLQDACKVATDSSMLLMASRVDSSLQAVRRARCDEWLNLTSTHLRVLAGRQAWCKPPAAAPAPRAAPTGATMHSKAGSGCAKSGRTAAKPAQPMQSAMSCYFVTQSNPAPHLQDVGHCHFKLPPLLWHPSRHQWLLLLQAGCGTEGARSASTHCRQACWAADAAAPAHAPGSTRQAQCWQLPQGMLTSG